MKIYYMSNSFIPSKSANSVHVMKMCNAFLENGHNIKLFARDLGIRSEDIFDDYGIPNSFEIVYNTWPNIKYLGGLIYGIRNAKSIRLYNDKPNILYGRDLYSLLFSSGFNIPLIYEAHVFPDSFKKRYMEKRLFKKNNFYRLIVISNALKKKYIEQYSDILNNDNVIVAHDACNIVKYKAPSDNLYSIGYVGHLYPGKGMEIIEKIAHLMPEYEFNIIGGTNKDINYWKNRINTNNIIFHGFVKQSELHKYYEKFNIVLAPYMKSVVGYKGKDKGKGKYNLSNWMSPLKVFEYMSYKKAIIASDLPVLREVLNDKNSILCDPENISEWINAIKKLAIDNSIREQIADKAFSDFVNKYTWEKRAELVIKA